MPKSYSACQITFKNNIIPNFLDRLGSLNFDGLEERDHTLLIYYSTEEFKKELRSVILDLNLTEETEVKFQEVPYQNWNNVWEKNYPPVLIDDFCGIYSSFHTDRDKSRFTYIINITPKMSFGTGHHATTASVIRLMKQITFTNKRILDFGCGTAILGILAEKMGANDLLAIDYDDKCVENAIENAELNQINHMQFRLDDQIRTEDGQFEIILCNITRNTILANIEALVRAMKLDSIIIFSGYFASEKHIIEKACKAVGLTYIDEQAQGDWIAQLFKRSA